MSLVTKMNNKTLRYAVSIASGWAWGVSLVVGMQLIQTKGWIPFTIWAIANSLALPLFGFIAFRIPNLRKIINSKPITIFTTAICVFCLWIQMNAIFQYIEKLDGASTTAAIAVTFFIVTPLVFLLYKNGLNRLINFDNPLWYAVYLLLLALLAYGLFTDVPHYIIPTVAAPGDIQWAINSIFILFSGPIMFIQNWQMAEKLNKEKQMRSYYYAGGLFSIYMLLVGVLGVFNFSGLANAVLLLCVILIALTTADAAVLGMHRILGRRLVRQLQCCH